MSALISIAMPFYNAEKTFAAAIQSVMLQTHSDWELLLCDDGSTDNSTELARSFRDSRITVWGSRERLQLGARLNECIARARGRYIARMDADDIAYPRRLEKQLDFLAANPSVDLVGGWAVLFAEGGLPIGKRNDPATHRLITRWPLYSFKLIHPTFMGKASWFRRYPYRVDAIRCEDHDLLFRAHANSQFANLAEIVLGYRQGKIDLRKCLRSRWMWSRCAKRYLDLPGRLSVNAVEVLKGGRDIVAVTTRADRAWLRSRSAALTKEEMEEWRQVWASVS